jgi:hypothetical protein
MTWVITILIIVALYAAAVCVWASEEQQLNEDWYRKYRK